MNSVLKYCFIIATVCLTNVTLPIFAQKIDRAAVVKRNIPTLNHLDPYSSFTVGNSNFAFTSDITGLQSFPEKYPSGAAVQLGTMAQWGFHSTPNPANYNIFDYPLTTHEIGGKKRGYLITKNDVAGNYLDRNPHRFHLGFIGLQMTLANGNLVKAENITAISQNLDIWNGVINSLFIVEGVSVKVQTCVHPTTDLVAIKIESELIKQGRLKIKMTFPYANSTDKEADFGIDWTKNSRHSTVLIPSKDKNEAPLYRSMDNINYYAHSKWDNGSFALDMVQHIALITPDNKKNSFSYICHFNKGSYPETNLPDFETTKATAAEYWHGYWNRGAFIDFGACTDPQAKELERRVILSQYLTATQCAGNVPPQECGLTQNSWVGRSHLEMHWWHGFHFMQWGKKDMFEKSMPWYYKIMPLNEKIAKHKGRNGFIVPKCVDDNGVPRVNFMECYIFWQQPHPIYYAEKLYELSPTAETLNKYKELVLKTGDGIVSFFSYNAQKKQYYLGNYQIPAQEAYDAATVINPTFELAYFYFGLTKVQEWRKRLAMPPDAEIDKILNAYPPLPTHDGVYIGHENAPDTYTKYNRDHFSMLMVLGFLPQQKIVDKQTVARTFEKVLQTWNFSKTWGWDYAVLAMTASKLGLYDKTVEMLLKESPQNIWRNNGNNSYNNDLSVYLPGNGAVLSAIAMMVKDNSFPKNGKWNVKTEGF